MTTITSIDIMNAALRRAGQDPILSEDDDSTRARTVKAEYPIILKSLTRSHPWRHATAYRKLSPISPKPAEIFDFAYAFQLPQDCLRMLSTDMDVLARWSEIEGGLVVCDQGALTVKFIRLVEDTSKFGASFTEVFIWQLAAAIAPMLTNSTERAKLCSDRAKEELVTARSFDAQIGMLDRVIADDFTRGRRY